MVSLSGSCPRPSVEELLNGISKISGHRQVLLRLNSLLEDESRGVADLVAVLRLDAGLCARVISAANTVFFRGGMPVSSVDEAVIRVGAWEIRRLLLGSITFELTAGGLNAYRIPAGELWNRSLACALAMDTLGREARRSTDVCYTIGLLHMIGMVVVDRWLNRTNALRVESIDATGPTDDRAEKERAVVGYTSAEIGGHLLSSWKFPEGIVATVTHQDTPFRAGRFRRLACLLALARWQADTILASLDNGPLPELPDSLVMRLAGVEADEAFRLIDPVRVRFLDYKAAVGVI